jgi:hypothetical protein
MKYQQIFFLLLLQPLLGTAQSYNSFKVTKAKYNFTINDKQGADSRFIEYDAKTNEFLRSVEYPKYGIEIFDVKSRKLKQTIYPKLEKLDVFKKITNNQYWVHDPWLQTFYLINAKGEVLKKIDEPKQSNDKVLSIYTGGSAFCPISIFNNSLYITGGISLGNAATNTKQYKIAGIVEKIAPNGNVSFIGRPATISVNNYFGFLNGYTSTLNKDILVVSPLYSDEIQLINLKTNTLKLLKLNTRFNALIKPLGLIEKKNDFNSAKMNLHFMENYKTVGMVYDSYKNVFYRFVRWPSKGFDDLTFSILVIDHDFKILFEKTLDSTYSPGQFFITPLGLAIFNKAAYVKDATSLSFDLFVLNN